ncbi:MRN1 RNA-binding protein MRN1 [Candida maltosa Xu316]
MTNTMNGGNIIDAPSIGTGQFYHPSPDEFLPPPQLISPQDNNSLSNLMDHDNSFGNPVNGGVGVVPVGNGGGGGVPVGSGGMPGGNGNGNGNSRTVYLGNLPNDILPNELLDYVRSGILEDVKFIPNKNCAFISFIDTNSALLFHSDCVLKKLCIKNHNIRVGWGKDSPILPNILEAIQRDGATRNVYLGNLDPNVTEEEIREDLSNFGLIDSIKIIPDNISSAINCVMNLSTKFEKYSKVFYGKDRCAFITKTQQHNAAQYLGLAPGMEHIVTAADREFISSALVQQSAAAAQIATQAGGANNLGNRTVYLGNLHQDSSVEEICNVVRGGLLQSIRFLKERHVCFITFIDPIAAAQFFAMCQLHGLTIHNRRIKVGWGKHSGPLSNALSLAVSNGASRNIYIGNIVDFEYYNPNKLRDDFSKFGDIEQINYLEEKNCAFINFVNIANAIKAIDGIKSFDDYKNLKINFGKDRCGNLPRQFQNQNLPIGGGALGIIEDGDFRESSPFE